MKSLFHILVLSLATSIGVGQVTILEKGEGKVLIVADTKESTPAGAAVLEDAGNWLAQSLQKSSRAVFPVTKELSDAPGIVVSTKANWPQVAKDAGSTTSKYDAYAIVTKTMEKRIYVLGNSEESARFGVADLLRRWGVSVVCTVSEMACRPEVGATVCLLEHCRVAATYGAEDLVCLRNAWR